MNKSQLRNIRNMKMQCNMIPKKKLITIRDSKTTKMTDMLDKEFKSLLLKRSMTSKRFQTAE
jgi:hypothetical protein